MRIAIVGPGAIGGLLAESLLDAGHEVSLVARDARGAARIRKAGLTIGRRKLRAWTRVAASLGKSDAVDAVFFCVKAPMIENAVRSVRGAVGPKTIVVSLLNGLAHVIPMRRAFGRTRAVFGSCYIAAMRSPSGAIVHSGGEHILLGRSGANSAAVKAAHALLARAGWKVKTVGSEERLLWTKLVYNAAVNPIGALLDRTNGELASDPALRELVRLVLKESVAIATRAGFKPLHRDMEARIARGCLAVPAQVNSMAQDLRAGRETEADAILKPLLDAAKRRRMRATTIEPLYRALKFLEKSAR